MWRHEHSVVVKASKASVWALWTNVEQWPSWDTDLSEAALQGDLEPGVEGKIKVADDALVSFVVTEVVPEERFTFQTKMFGAKLTFVHELSEEEAGLRVTHRAELSGMLGFIWRFIVAGKVKGTLAPALDNLAKLAAEAPAPAAPEQPVEGEVPAAEPAAETTTENPAPEAPAEPAAPVETSAETSVEAPAEEQPAAEQEPEAAAEAPAAAEPATEDAAPANDAPVPAAEEVEGDPAENELREKDIHEQIEKAAEAEVPAPEAPAEPAAQEEAPAETLAEEQPAEAPAAEPAAPTEQEPEAPAETPAPEAAPVASEAPEDAEAPVEQAAPEEPAAPAEPTVSNDAPGVTPPADDDKPKE